MGHAGRPHRRCDVEKDVMESLMNLSGMSTDRVHGREPARSIIPGVDQPEADQRALKEGKNTVKYVVATAKSLPSSLRPGLLRGPKPRGPGSTPMLNLPNMLRQIQSSQAPRDGRGERACPGNVGRGGSWPFSGQEVSMEAAAPDIRENQGVACGPPPPPPPGSRPLDHAESGFLSVHQSLLSCAAGIPPRMDHEQVPGPRYLWCFP